MIEKDPLALDTETSLATVVAAEPTVVLTLPAALLNALVRENADVASQIRAAVAERVARA